MNGLCKTCRHWRLIIEKGERIADDKPAVWDEEEGKYHFPYEYHEWTLPPEREGWRPCALLNDDYRDDRKLITPRESVTIETAPDFGCVQWQAQETS